MIYANDNDPSAAHWLRCLPLGIHAVDDRSIKDIKGDDLAGFTQCHFFAGIGGWPYALQLAGWPTDAAVWTGSCPCQPFSSAGKRKGNADERHLWPEFRRLIAECRPPVVFGEQVASKAGRDWLSGVRTDLEALGYAVGAADLCAAGVGAPHIRQRLFWVAYAESERGRGWSAGSAGARGRCGTQDDRRLGDTESIGHWQESQRRSNSESQDEGRQHIAGRPVAPHWSDVEYVPCRDGKARPVKPGVRLLAHGVPGRVAQLRGLGNAIVPQVAAAFIGAFMEAVP